MDGFEHGGGAGVGVDGAVDPGVAMVAGDDPGVLVFGVGAVDGADHVPDGAELVVLLEVHVDLDRAGAAEMVGERQAALPLMRDVGAVEGFEDGRGVLVAERVDRDGRLVHFGRVGDALGVGEVGRGGYAGGFGVAGVERKKLDRPALDGGVGAHGAAGVLVAADVAVVGGVGVDDDAGGAVLLGDVGLDTAEVAAVADEDDLAFDVDAEFGELLEVVEGAVVGVDGLGGDVTGAGGAVERGEDARVVLEGVAAVGVGVDVLGRGAGHELVALRVDGGDLDLEGLVEEDLVLGRWRFRGRRL